MVSVVRHSQPVNEITLSQKDVEISSKHGVIADSSFKVQSSHITSTASEYLRRELSGLLRGQRYGFLEGCPTNGADVNENFSGHELNDLYAWVKHTTDIIV